MSKQFISLFLGLFFLLSFIQAEGISKDVYIIIYATYKGKTGHTGIALDKYKVVVHEKMVGDSMVYVDDTIKTSELMYFDFWPNEDQFNKIRTAQNINGIYYRLPENMLEELTLNTFADKGIPHRENYSCDGLIRIRTSFQQDKRLLELIDSIIHSNRQFNARHFNCTDFVLISLKELLRQKINAREFIPFAFSSTPNKLYRRLVKLKQVEVLKNADSKTRDSFLMQRVFYKIFNS